MQSEMMQTYLGGNYRPTQSEIEARDLGVIGHIPHDLEGMFIRTGSNPRYEPLGRYHWFDGDGMLHGVQLGGGNATYRNRYEQGKARVRFYRDQPSRFGIIPRHGAKESIRWFEASPCYIYHTINAWDDGDEVVMVGCKIENPLAADPLNPKSKNGRLIPILGMLELAPVLYKWRFNLKTGGVKEQQLDDAFSEFPRMDNRVLGRKSRFSYNPRVADAATLLFDGVIKYDTDSGAKSEFSYPAGCYGGETVFAPRTGSTAEDDGYVITFVANEASGESELYVLDAKNISGEPVARIPIPQRVPTGYHTWWVTAENLAGQRPLEKSA